jgi:hypothetical protein
MSEYKWLHSKEKEALEECGRDMKNAVNDLDNACTRGGVGYPSWRRHFTDGRDQVTVIYKKLWEKGRYFDDLSAEFVEGKKELEKGKSLLREAENEITGAGVYADLLKKVGKCLVLMGKYSRIWTAIRIFDSKYQVPWQRRQRGFYATLPTAGEMDAMRGLLAEMGALSWHVPARAGTCQV